MNIICGLGNPGRQYNNTRHNIGFKFIEKLIITNKFEQIKTNKFFKLYSGQIQSKQITLIKPSTFMNLSGEAILNYSKFYKFEPSKLLIIHDDLDLKIGKIKFKIGGGNGGHNGLLSLDQNIGNSYNRLRIGIGKPQNKNYVNKYVLNKFNDSEKKFFDKVINVCIKNIFDLFNDKNIFLTKTISEIQKL
ncbi:MAG: Peptidyl-tRNA hydrolase [Alphaproteobacteria bacterium MarineAlpha5_Bin9]|nr:MAG: Peptidyl-tRNA hydrolase [Alphaproteobacteria bacterium MarineAlpha5_Bin9]